MTYSYSTDSAERRYIPFFIAAAAIGATYLFAHLLTEKRIEVPWWLGLPVDTMAFYGLFYWLFDRFLWKWRPLRLLRIIRVPNISGEWRGQVRPAPTPGVSAGLTSAIDISLSIRQTWTELGVSASTTLSRSHSLSGAFVLTDGPSLSYEFVNEPSPTAPSTMHAHRGVARMTLNGAQTVLEGEYYSGRDRQNVGSIRVTRSTS